MTIKSEPQSSEPSDEFRATPDMLVVAGGLTGAIAASSCCILPLVLFGMGVSGAWIGNLTALAPYQPYLVALTAGLLIYGYWLVRRRSAACASGAACARPVANRVVRGALAVATVLIAVTIGFNLFVPYLR